MNFKKHRKDFNKRWDIVLSDSYEEAFHKFKQRIINIFQDIKLMCGDIHTTYYLRGIDDIVTEESSLDFCQYYSISEKWTPRPGLKGAFEALAGNNCKITIIDRLRNETNEKEFYKLIEVILNMLNIREGFATPGKKTKLFLTKKVTQAVEMSDVNVTATKTENGIILYPKGAEKLDGELVNKIFSFLNDKSNEHFEKAFKFYQSNNLRESADNLRRSVEEFLRYKLKNTTGLTKNIQNLQKILKKNNNPSETRDVIFTIFNHLDKHFNEHSKHGNNVGEPENEFLIYQTGLLLRYIDREIPQGKKSDEIEN